MWAIVIYRSSRNSCCSSGGTPPCCQWRIVICCSLAHRPTCTYIVGCAFSSPRFLCCIFLYDTMLWLNMWHNVNTYSCRLRNQYFFRSVLIIAFNFCGTISAISGLICASMLPCLVCQRHLRTSFQETLKTRLFSLLPNFICCLCDLFLKLCLRQANFVIYTLPTSASQRVVWDLTSHFVWLWLCVLASTLAMLISVAAELMVDPSGIHSLVCRHAPGRATRHLPLKDCIFRAQGWCHGFESGGTNSAS